MMMSHSPRGRERSRSMSIPLRGRERSFSRSTSRSRGRKPMGGGGPSGPPPPPYRGERRPVYRSRSRSRGPMMEMRRSYSRSPVMSRRRGGYEENGSHRMSSPPRESERRRPYLPPSSSRDYGRGGGGGGGGRQQENPQPNKCLGVFGLSLRTTERDLREVFSRYGPIEESTVVIDAQTGRSRGFSFIYFENLEDAKAAKESCNGIEIDGRRIRVDFSITQRAHTPTPGIYMGKPSMDGRYRRGGGGGGGGRRDDYYRGERDRGYRRSPSPYRGGGGSRRRYSRSPRSYSPRRITSHNKAESTKIEMSGKRSIKK